ncbi:hypothetical protein [Streptomyces justiciae]|nr:hypothetical protein [Streptomyces justiciae]
MTGTTGICPVSMALTRPTEAEGRMPGWGPKMPVGLMTASSMSLWVRV